MSAAEGVPAWARPVLEELRGFADAAWRGLASQDRVTAAWAGAMRDAITAALAADAGKPFFHKLGCPKISGRGTAAHCTCPPDRERPERTPAAESPTNAPETSASPVDAELDRLLIEYARCQVLAHDHNAVAPQSEVSRRAYEVEWAAAAIRAHVERVKRDAYADGHRAGARIMAQVHRDSRREKEEG